MAPILAVLGEQRDPDRGGEAEADARHGHGAFEPLDERSRQTLSSFTGLDSRNQHGKLTFATAPNDAFVEELIAESRGDFVQEKIGDVGAVSRADALEPIEVDEHQREAVARLASRGEHLFEPLPRMRSEQIAGVGRAGHRFMLGATRDSEQIGPPRQATGRSVPSSRFRALSPEPLSRGA